MRSATRPRPSARPWFVPRPRGGPLGSRSDGADRTGRIGRPDRARRSSQRADSARAERSSAAKSITTVLAALAPPAVARASSRCRASRRSSATCRFSSAIACLPPTFVARSAPNAPRTLVSVREFDRYQGKGVPDGLREPVAAADVPRSRPDADRRGSAATRWTRSSRRCAAQHGAVLRRPAGFRLDGE